MGMLEAAGAEGYENASVRSVLDRAGLYRQAFYDNFSSKDDCFLHAYDAGLKRVEVGVRAGASPQTTWRGQLRGGLGALLDLLESQPDIGRALFVEVHPAGSEAVAKKTAAIARAGAFLDRARQEAPDGEKAPPIASEAIASGIHTVIRSRLSCGESGFRPLLGELMYFAVLPYYGAEAAKDELPPVSGLS